MGSREPHLESKIERNKLEIFRFTWNEILPHKVRKCKFARRQSQETQDHLDRNGEAFIHWVVALLSAYVSSPPKGKKWHALAIHMNEKNINYLSTQIDLWLWVDIGPICCQELDDHEYGIDPTAILTDTP